MFDQSLLRSLVLEHAMYIVNLRRQLTIELLPVYEFAFFRRLIIELSDLPRFLLSQLDLEYHDLLSLFEFLDNGDGQIT